MCLVSVIIPAYNTEKYIRKCIESVMGQTLRDIEIIIVNDGSTDSTPIIAEELRKQDSRIQVFHQGNKGIGASRKQGLSMAKGTYIQFVDSDDWIDNNYLEIMTSIALKTETDIVDSCSRIDKKIHLRSIGKIFIDNIKYELTMCNSYDIANMIVRRRHSCVLWSKLFKKEFLDKYNLDFDEGIDFGEDAFFLCKACYYRPEYVLINKNFYHQTDNPTSTTKSKYTRDKFLCRINWVRQLYDFFDDIEFRESIRSMKFFIKEEAAMSGLYSQNEYSMIFPEIMPNLNEIKLGFVRKFLFNLANNYDNRKIGHLISTVIMRRFLRLEDCLWKICTS